MILRIVLVGAFFAAALVVAREQELFEKAGIVGRCEVIRAPAAAANSEWRACHEGILTGYPNLSLDDCTRAARGKDVEYWRCPPRASRRGPSS